MLRTIMFFGLVAMSVSASAASFVSDNLYFLPDWCPRSEEIEELSLHLSISKKGCCVQSGKFYSDNQSLRQQVEARWKDRLTSCCGYPSASCNGRVETDEEFALRAAAVKERERQVQEDIAARLESAPDFLKGLREIPFCVAYGDGLRDKPITGFGHVPGIAHLLRAEAKRRGIRFNDEHVRNGTIYIGMRSCALFAGWGFPDDINRTVGRWGESTQYVYGTNSSYIAFVYLENGKVTGWQD